MSVVLSAPAVFRFTSPADPECRLHAAELMGLDTTGVDADDLVAGALPQHTVTRLSPRPANAGDLRGLFLDSMTLW
jgi:hydroxyacid-oxoacid transhydrogenase